MPTVIVQRRGAVLEIVLNRPAVLNAANREMIGELAAAAAEAAQDAASRVVLLRGAGSHFCAGGDINMFGELISLEPAAREQALHVIVDTLHPLLITLRQMPKPVVVAAQGAAAGFGLSLVLAADLAIAAEDCVFASGYIYLGTSPDGGMTMILATHEMGFARDVASRVGFLDGGRILEMSPPAELFAEPKEARTRQFLARVMAAGRL